MNRLLLAVLLATAITAAAADRSSAAKSAFKRSNPCPVTGLSRGPCLGYVIDHVEPLCAGGLDAPVNMQWQTVEDAKVKDRTERSVCRAMWR